MATTSAWLSVLVKRAQNIVVPRTVVNCSWDETFGMLLGKLGMPDAMIDRVQIASTEKFIDPHVVPIDAPVSICEQFNCIHVCIFVEGPPVNATERMSNSRPNAFDVLMASSHEIVLPPIRTCVLLLWTR